jgi:hypothetical protein
VLLASLVNSCLDLGSMSKLPLLSVCVAVQVDGRMELSGALPVVGAEPVLRLHDRLVSPIELREETAGSLFRSD